MVANSGKRFDAARFSSAFAAYAIIADVRAGMDGPLDVSGGGRAPFRKKDRSQFLQALERGLVRLRQGLIVGSQKR